MRRPLAFRSLKFAEFQAEGRNQGLCLTVRHCCSGCQEYGSSVSSGAPTGPVWFMWRRGSRLRRTLALADHRAVRAPPDVTGALGQGGRGSEGGHGAREDAQGRRGGKQTLHRYASFF